MRPGISRSLTMSLDGAIRRSRVVTSYQHANRIMQMSSTALPRFSRTGMKSISLVVLAAVVTVGIVACDSSGPEDEEPRDEIAQTFQVTVASIEGTDYPYSDQNSVGVAYALDGTVAAIEDDRRRHFEFSVSPLRDRCLSLYVRMLVSLMMGSRKREGEGINVASRGYLS